MAASFPNDIVTYTDKTDGVDDVEAAHINSLQDEMVATQTYVRPKLAAARTYYVRTDGSDSNDGLTNTSGGAFLTIQAAVNATAALDINGYAVTIQVAAGTYTGAITLKNVVGYTAPGDLIIQGAGATTIISTTSANCFSVTSIPCVWDIKDLKKQTTTSGTCIEVIDAYARLSGVEFGASASNHMRAANGGKIEFTGNYTVSGNCTNHLFVTSGGIITCRSRTVTVSASITVTYFAVASLTGILFCDGNTYSLGAFTVTGTRYSGASNAVIYTNGGGASYFPGTVGGATATGAQYI